MTRPSETSDSPLFDPLDPGAMEAIVAGEHGGPFDVLGPHVMQVHGESVWVIRVFLPGAQAVWVAPTAAAASGEAAWLPMRRLHPAGLFSALGVGAHAPAYELVVQRPDGREERLADPYAAAPMFTDFDLHLIGEGKHLNLYERLGAHARTLDGVQGVGFAVWAPNARRVSVVGDFNGWDDRAHPMRLHTNGVWELFIPGLASGALYKYSVLSWNQGYRALKADPYAFWAEVRPGTASRVYELAGYEWGDASWLRARRATQAHNAPLNVYEVHAGSWRTPSGGGDQAAVSYRDLARQLVPYVKDMGYTHIELMPIAEHPFDGSWGYQVTGYFAPTSRFGEPHDFMYFVDYCHQHDVGVIIDWVPAHFPKDGHALSYFDGTHLYEHDDPRQGEQLEWGTYVFNFGRNEVRNFLVANALFWAEQYHIDGLRVDAVASMLYLDYARADGQWVANRFGGRENLEAVGFLKEFNSAMAARFPDVLTIAEESTAWPGVTRAVEDGGLGFSLKWNMGWMHDILEYMRLDPVHRRRHHSQLTFSLAYAFSERFILPFSHDEVVHMKGSMLNKMPGDRWKKFANLRALYGFMAAHPGKKLLFMGGETGQWAEWSEARFLDWSLLDAHGPDGALHEQLQRLVRDLNHAIIRHPSLHQLDFDPSGFQWIDGSDVDQSVIAFMRYGAEQTDPLLVVCNFTPVPRIGYRVGAPTAGYYAELLNTDAGFYGGSNVGNLGGVMSEPVKAHGMANSLALSLPPLATLFFAPAAAPSTPTAPH